MIDDSIRIGDPLKIKSLGWENKINLKNTAERILEYWRKNY